MPAADGSDLSVHESRPYTSNLGAAEFALLRGQGVEIAGQVFGYSAYQLGQEWRTGNWRDGDRGVAFGFELPMNTEGFAEARRLALGRMRREAQRLGATGVVGVTLDWKVHSLGEHMEGLEFRAAGTAVRERFGAGQVPFLSNLSCGDYTALRRAGYRPAGLVAGNCSYRQVPSPETTRLFTSGPLAGGVRANREIREHTDALYQARELALQRLEEEARALSADGVLNIRFDTRIVRDEMTLAGMAFHVAVLGTAIRAVPGQPRFLPVAAILPLR